jgi:ornithine carbamoyltransferase
MNLALSQRLLSRDTLSFDDARVLRDMTEALCRAAEAGMDGRLLRGKNIAVLGHGTDRNSTNAIETAAIALGARVSHIPRAALTNGDGMVAIETTRLMGRLYDAVACDDLPRERAERLQRVLGVPVFNGLLRHDHPLQSLLSERLPETLVLQALLVITVA